jgi:hypothetical protein
MRVGLALVVQTAASFAKASASSLRGHCQHGCHSATRMNRIHRDGPVTSPHLLAVVPAIKAALHVFDVGIATHLHRTSGEQTGYVTAVRLVTTDGTLSVCVRHAATSPPT